MGGTLQSWYQSEHMQGPSWPVTPPNLNIQQYEDFCCNFLCLMEETGTKQ